jgi:hypothetical protein
MLTWPLTKPNKFQLNQFADSPVPFFTFDFLRIGWTTRGMPRVLLTHGSGQKKNRFERAQRNAMEKIKTSSILPQTPST